MNDELWTIEQLPDRVAELLSDNYGGQSNGRVAELPNGRTIRWYTTIGLVDRPADTRGRTALYGRRHLLQLVAVKKLQAAGHTLAEIQKLIVGATDKQLALLAGVERLAPVDINFAKVPIEVDFWKLNEHRRPKTEPDTVNNTAIDTVRRVHGIRLGDSVTVVLDDAIRAPDDEEIAAIEAAAAPLLELLGRMGLASTTRGESR
ncbi:MAG TPA: helix-turn-helix domain-containing protein [Actinophytocola sp.]|nr:helix-turn-helix domain-containing protein [Actinophytocola sp.]